MAITIDWFERIIYVPRNDLTLIQASPTEIRELDLDWFHRTLRDLEDDEGGMTNPATHTHNTEVTLGGLIYARVIEIINGYTVTFEDGQYAVNLVGANSNVGDVVNVNQVSVRSQNSAGLISSRAMEFSSFQYGVWIDFSSDNIGTAWPSGTAYQPVNNLADAKLIAENNGLSVLYIVGNATFGPGDILDGYIIVGQNPVKSAFVLTSGVSTIGCEFREATISGTLSGNAYIRHCEVTTLTYVEGRIVDCTLLDTITLAGLTTTNIINCRDGIAGDGKPVIDMGVTGQALTITGFYGEIQIRNKTGTEKVSIDIDSGEVELDSSVTNGEIYVRGTGRLSDNSTGSAVVYYNGLVSRDLYDDIVYVDVANGTSGTQLPVGTIHDPVNNMEDAKIICGKTNIKKMSIDGSVQLGSAYSGYKFVAPFLSAATIDMNGQDVSGSVFVDIIIEGGAVGPFQAIGSRILGGMTNIQATCDDCMLSGSFSIQNGQALSLDRCNLEGVSNVFDLNGNGRINFAGVSGLFQISGMTGPGAFAAVTGEFVCTIDPTCTAGVAFVAGNGVVNNLSNGTSVTDKVSPGAVWDSSVSNHGDTGTFGNMMSKIKTWVNYLRRV